MFFCGTNERVCRVTVFFMCVCVCGRETDDIQDIRWNELSGNLVYLALTLRSHEEKKRDS